MTTLIQIPRALGNLLAGKGVGVEGRKGGEKTAKIVDDSFKSNLRESWYLLNCLFSKPMDYLIKEEDMLALKMEDNSDQYLFNSLLDIG